MGKPQAHSRKTGLLVNPGINSPGGRESFAGGCSGLFSFIRIDVFFPYPDEGRQCADCHACTRDKVSRGL